ncbi:MAG TPA: neutral/alkaline non-lysosomal ceramidase N-terminal domain-containing protein [Oscillospiraceae bacterium]|nr:neutral/alkaline non-lysosomal ceramidase N-terminal domain-containing protein [Oscillospiraceae bacterium]
MNKGKIASDLIRKGFKLGAKMAQKSKEVQPIPKGKFDYIKNVKSKKFTVGFGKTEILPDDLERKKYYVAGYGINNPATGVLDTPFAHAVWIDDNSGRGAVVFVSIDNVGMLNKDVKDIKSSLSKFMSETRCRSIEILSTHSHAGIDTMGIWGPLPLTGRDKYYIEVVKAGVRSAVKKAYMDKRDGDIFKGQIEVPDMQKDIRTPEVFSKTLTRLRFVPDDGERQVYFINFAAHSESLSSKNSLVSADFPCYLRRKIFRETGAETIYFVGAIGGMITMHLLDEDKPKSTKMIGEKLANYALSIKKEKKLKPNLSMMRQSFYFEADNTVLLIAGLIGILKVNKYTSQKAPLKIALKSEMAYFEFDDLKMLLIPGELFPELLYGGYLSKEESATGKGSEINPKPLVEICSDKELLVFGLANDEVGYIIPPNDFLLDENMPYLSRAKDIHGRKHYEETNSLGIKTAEKLAKVFEEMYKEVLKTKNN